MKVFIQCLLACIWVVAGLCHQTTHFGTRGGGYRLSINRVENGRQLTPSQETVKLGFFGCVVFSTILDIRRHTTTLRGAPARGGRPMMQCARAEVNSTDMQDIVFNGRIGSEEPATVRISIRAAVEDDPLEEIVDFGIIDTGSKQCVINVGVFDEGVFTQESDGDLADGIGRQFDSRHREMVVRLIQDGNVKQFRVPVYEMTLGLFPRGTRVMLIGRTILNQGVLVYDGMNQKWNMTFSGD